jgi:hypothetical protein
MTGADGLSRLRALVDERWPGSPSSAVRLGRAVAGDGAGADG